MSIPTRISIPTKEFLDFDPFLWEEPSVCDDETAMNVATALENSGFVLGTKFKIVSKGSCVASLSMLTPVEGQRTPEEMAISYCKPGIGPDSIAVIEGTSMNGMMGKSMTLFNGGSISEWYMARINNPFGDGINYIPILARIRFVKNKIEILHIVSAELPFF